MNWRGRPLTSHEVILESIASAFTRTGLRVKAELDTNTYPTGIGVGDAEMAALPLTRHTFHGEWNYALHPQPKPAIPAARSGRPPTPQLLSDPALTGLAPHQLQHLIRTLTPAGDTRRGRPPRLTFADQVLATVLHLRVNLAAEPLAVLFSSSRTAMHRTLLKIRHLLEAQDITISPATTPPAALAALRARVAAQSSSPNSKIKTTG
ncbi:transposase [Streptomyces azureus]|uniref:Transposase n=1 Tax=Streptomyces azureus TaxID=146537 RepID=A0A0K8PGP2_STRAJ|nr:transposase [Streptomyces azureus]